MPIAPDHVDWDILCTFGVRTEEFLTHYETCAWLTEEDKFALMTMIISSYDDWLGKGGDPNPLAERLRKLLLADFAIHESTVCDWCFWHLPPEIRTHPDYIFPITPFVREIWLEVRSPNSLWLPTMAAAQRSRYGGSLDVGERSRMATLARRPHFEGVWNESRSGGCS